MLDKKLEEYSQSNMYPYHMPGHKRKEFEFPNPYTIDITEITGFDNLHQPTGLIREMMNHMKDLYHSDECYLLVNGSTGGNLSSIYSACEQQDEILIARNSHKSVYNAVYLRKLKAFYLEPQILESGIAGEVTVEEVIEKIEQHPKAKAIVITSPTYEGIMSDLTKIVTEAHKRGVAVIVDGAHGAHLGFPSMLESPVASGADVVIMSLHKTLPSFTQTAILCYQDKGYISKKKLEEYLGIFQTSSPSYILLSGISKCITYLENAKQEFIQYAKRLQNFYESVKELQHLTVLREKHMDFSKIVISTRGTNISGEELFEMLQKDYQLEMEMASYDYVLAMTSVMDTQEGLDRLSKAIIKIDSQLAKCDKISEEAKNISYQLPTKKMEIYEAKEKEHEIITLKSAIGKVAGEMISLYPPGIPVIVAGEEITEQRIQQLQLAKQQGLAIIGLETEDEKDDAQLWIKVVKQ